ncbi:hypothetical protein HK098_003160 [Nowakowskiella sp. JEL0407]|nr:hypothetical protein HK098_003160 [Nowakowskiella sp. JEL0407]
MTILFISNGISGVLILVSGYMDLISRTDLTIGILCGGLSGVLISELCASVLFSIPLRQILTDLNKSIQSDPKSTTSQTIPDVGNSPRRTSKFFNNLNKLNRAFIRAAQTFDIDNNQNFSSNTDTSVAPSSPRSKSISYTQTKKIRDTDEDTHPLRKLLVIYQLVFFVNFTIWMIIIFFTAYDFGSRLQLKHSVLRLLWTVELFIEVIIGSLVRGAVERKTRGSISGNERLVDENCAEEEIKIEISRKVEDEHDGEEDN